MSNLDLTLAVEELEVEPLAESNALASVSTCGCVSTTSCPLTIASTFGSFSSYT